MHDMKDSFSTDDNGCYARGRGDVEAKESHPKEYEDLEIIPQSDLDRNNNNDLEENLAGNEVNEDNMARM